MKLLFVSFVTVLFTFCFAACNTDTGRLQSPPTQKISVAEILSEKSTENPWESKLDSAPDAGCVRLPLRWTGRLKTEFNDSNHAHIAAARIIGIDPIHSSSDILSLKRPIVRVQSCEDFYVEPPTHSFPYLVPEAERLLHEIGKRFNDSLAARGGGSYRIKVTSLLRTPATVRRLSRVNRNASAASTHSQFAANYNLFPAP